MVLRKKDSKRESESHLRTGRKFCSLQYASNNSNGHGIGSISFLWQDTDCPFLKASWNHFPLAFSASGSSTLIFQPEGGEDKQGGSLCVEVSSRTGPRALLYPAYMRAPERCQSADFLTSKHIKAWKTSPFSATDSVKRKSTRVGCGFRHRNPGAMLAHKWNFPHIAPISWGALAADMLLTFAFLNSVYTSQRPLPDGKPCCSGLRCYSLQLPTLSLCSKLQPNCICSHSQSRTLRPSTNLVDHNLEWPRNSWHFLLFTLLGGVINFETGSEWQLELVTY